MKVILLLRYGRKRVPWVVSAIYSFFSVTINRFRKCFSTYLDFLSIDSSRYILELKTSLSFWKQTHKLLSGSLFLQHNFRFGSLILKVSRFFINSFVFVVWPWPKLICIFLINHTTFRIVFFHISKPCINGRNLNYIVGKLGDEVCTKKQLRLSNDFKNKYQRAHHGPVTTISNDSSHRNCATILISGHPR